MFLKKQTNSTSGTRHQIKISKHLLSKYNNLIKSLRCQKIKNSGRNNSGKITVWHKGGEQKKRLIRSMSPQKTFSILISKHYNDTSNAFVALAFDLKRKLFFNVNSIRNAYIGSLCHYGLIQDYKLGFGSKLKNFPGGSIINSILIGRKCLYARSSGSFSQIVEKKGDFVKIKLPSGKVISLKDTCYAYLGKIDNGINKLTKVGKAGRNRLKGMRPHVRGVAMNPVDHPHGGKSNKGMIQVTPWGIPTKGIKTKKGR
jgi:large subunit ribosomal protein L2